MPASREEYLKIMAWWEADNRIFGQQVPPSEYFDFLESVRRLEANEPQWKDRCWVVQLVTQAFVSGLEMKGIKPDPEEQYRSRIDQIVANLEHPFMAKHLLELTLDLVTSAPEALDLIDDCLRYVVLGKEWAEASF